MAEVLLDGMILGEAEVLPPSCALLHLLVGSLEGLAVVPSPTYSLGHLLIGSTYGLADVSSGIFSLRHYLRGHIEGSASLSSPSCASQHILQGHAFGEALVQGGVPYRSMLVSGLIHGLGTLSMRDTTLSGHIFGSTNLSSNLVRVRYFHGHIAGSSRLSFAQPMPIQCGCNLSAFLDVVKVPRPICCKTQLKAFHWGQALQRGDLGVWLTQIGRGPISPYRVTYTLYQGLPGGVPKLIGPQERHPAQGDLGEYYATGTAGLGGQPGRWRIIWRYQLTYGGIVYEEPMCFMVNDAIASGVCPPSCTKQRGWF